MDSSWPLPGPSEVKVPGLFPTRQHAQPREDPYARSSAMQLLLASTLEGHRVQPAFSTSPPWQPSVHGLACNLWGYGPGEGPLGLRNASQELLCPQPVSFHLGQMAAQGRRRLQDMGLSHSTGSRRPFLTAACDCLPGPSVLGSLS